jgi:serine/threonine-protein kinase
MWKDMHGRTLGNFRLIKPIAAGGMGAVFFARKEAFGRFSQPAAVKLVHPHFANQRDFVDMFLDEARIASFVQHSNVCRVLDFGCAEGTYYLAMEYVHGETWGELFARASKDEESKTVLPEIAAYVIAQACEGLHAAHIATGEEGQPLHVVHRDV